MYEVKVEGRFRATHHLRWRDRPDEQPHEHQWLVAACYRGAELTADGVLVDFCAAGDDLQRVLKRCANSDLNRNAFLQGLNPTAEHLARRIFQTLYDMGGVHRRLVAVGVTEAPGCHAVYRLSTTPPATGEQ